MTRLRDAERLLKAGRYAEVLRIARDPALADHRRAAEARAAARRALAAHAAEAARDGRLEEAAASFAALRDDGPG
ncbi:MAG TPA: hypothetical protein VEI02_00740, partial [Planctomycetota bacterium]|nr:hypothetical protein [Planctomycetota bacterium]